MGVDKLRLITDNPPWPEFIESVNQDMALPSGFRDKRVYEVRFRNPLEERLEMATKATITTRKGIEPFFFLQMNSSVPGQGSRTILELNPNKLPEGLRTLRGLIAQVWGPDHEDFRITRIDLNGELDAPIDTLRELVRVPRKRKGTEYQDQRGTTLQVYNGAGTTGFRIGAPPAFLRVYDKREEYRRAGRDLGDIPATLSRFEWQLQHNRVPVRYLSELPELEALEPFSSIQFLERSTSLDFKGDPIGSQKRILLRELSLRYGAQAAIRILNRQRNFWRGYRDQIVHATDFARRLQESYLEGVRRFFNNEPVEWCLAAESE